MFVYCYYNVYIDTCLFSILIVKFVLLARSSRRWYEAVEKSEIKIHAKYGIILFQIYVLLAYLSNPQCCAGYFPLNHPLCLRSQIFHPLHQHMPFFLALYTQVNIATQPMAPNMITGSIDFKISEIRSMPPIGGGG